MISLPSGPSRMKEHGPFDASTMPQAPPYVLGEVLNCSESSGPRHDRFRVIHVDPTMSTIGPLYPELRTLASAAGMSQLCQ
jgi:hypothetical protein